MTKKKRFGMSQQLSQGFTETINVVENNENTFRNAIVPFSRIELDPDNPRKLIIDLNDIKNGIPSQDPNKKIKDIEIEKIRELANTIESVGLINPIVVYKKDDIYRIVAGERRCLASMLLGRTEIEAKIYNDRPNAFDLKLIQWIENNAREDLTLSERLENISDIQKEFKILNQKELTANELSQITGISLSQSACYLTVIKGPKTVRDLIEENKLNNLDKASLIANASSEEIRKQLIEELLGGASLKTLRQQASSNKQANKTVGRKQQRINMGFTQEPKVIKIITEALEKLPNRKSELPTSKGINWNDMKASSKFFQKLVKYLEKYEA